MDMANVLELGCQSGGEGVEMTHEWETSGRGNEGDRAGSES